MRVTGFSLDEGLSPKERTTVLWSRTCRRPALRHPRGRKNGGRSRAILWPAEPSWSRTSQPVRGFSGVSRSLNNSAGEVGYFMTSENPICHDGY